MEYTLMDHAPSKWSCTIDRYLQIAPLLTALLPKPKEWHLLVVAAGCHKGKRNKMVPSGMMFACLFFFGTLIVHRAWSLDTIEEYRIYIETLSKSLDAFDLKVKSYARMSEELDKIKNDQMDKEYSENLRSAMKGKLVEYEEIKMMLKNKNTDCSKEFMICSLKVIESYLGIVREICINLSEKRKKENTQDDNECQSEEKITTAIQDASLGIGNLVRNIKTSLETQSRRGA